MKIIPAILAKDLPEFITQLHRVINYFPYLQIDIMDGELVKVKNNITPQQITDITRGKQLEIHLMVKNVRPYLLSWSNLKNVKKIIWHYEADKKNTDQHLKLLKAKKIKAGLAINPNTKLSAIKPLIKNFDTIMIMGVVPGKMGQKFQANVLEKIKILRKEYPKLNIEVDGGVTDKNFSKIKKAGANLIAMGSYLQKAKDIESALKKLN